MFKYNKKNNIDNDAEFNANNDIDNEEKKECSSSKKTGKRKNKKFNEKRKLDVNNVDKISIYSPIAVVNLSRSQTEFMEISFNGTSKYDGNIRLEIITNNSQATISVIHTGEFHNSGLILNVAIPSKRYESIFVKTKSNDISVSSDIETNCLDLTSQFGSITTSAVFSETNISTSSGRIKLITNAKDDIIVYLSTISGDINADLNSIGYIVLNTRCRLGKVTNNHCQDFNFEHTAIVNVTTVGGNVIIN